MFSQKPSHTSPVTLYLAELLSSEKEGVAGRLAVVTEEPHQTRRRDIKFTVD